MAENTRYKLIKKLARGGMAEIYLGRKEAEDDFTQLVCIKRILPHYSQEKEYIEMFRDEAHICKRLQHSNIVRVESFEEVEESYAIIMEYVNGSDLRKLLVACENAKQPIPMAMLIYITAETAKGLHYAHTKIDEITQKPLKIVHRDVSPQNILISFDGEVKVTDFGIADAKNKSTETKPGIVKGKYSYMSPEQIMAKQVDARTDVFALAIILWEMVAMERLFHAENDVITIQKVKNGEIKPLPTQKRKEGEVDPELTAIIYKGLQKDIRKRYKSANHFEQALRSYLNKKYPKFSQSAFSDFLKSILKNQVDESNETIKEALTSLKEKPKKKFNIVDDSTESEIDEKLPELNQFQLAAPSGLKVSGQNVGRSTFNTPTPANTSLSNSRISPVSKIGAPPISSEARSQRPQVPTNRSPYSGKHKIATKKSGFKSPIQIIAIAIAVLAIAFISKQFLFNRTANAIVSFRVSPSNVQITVDGVKLENGDYIKTPTVLNLKPGKHVVKVSRSGYQTTSWKFNISPGEKTKKLDLALKRTAPVSPVKISISGAKSAYIDINDGLFTGNAPVKIGSLVYGKLHIMKIIPNHPSAQGAFSCSFTPTARTWKNPYEVTVSLSEKLCRAGIGR